MEYIEFYIWVLPSLQPKCQVKILLSSGSTDLHSEYALKRVLTEAPGCWTKRSGSSCSKEEQMTPWGGSSPWWPGHWPSGSAGGTGRPQPSRSESWKSFVIDFYDGI